MNDFCRMLESEIPRLRRYARALTRDASRADDLVQSCLTRAITKQHLWQPATDMRAWLFTVLHNQYVSDLRRSVHERNMVSIEDIIPVWGVKPDAFQVLELRDLEIAIGKLADEQRQVILLVGLEGMRYDRAAAILSIPIGTLRSRVSRAREQLRILMGMEAKHRHAKLRPMLPRKSSARPEFGEERRAPGGRSHKTTLHTTRVSRVLA
jgi:RNA polymerase sigma-70 factor, ECF subfamily